MFQYSSATKKLSYHCSRLEKVQHFYVEIGFKSWEMTLVGVLHPLQSRFHLMVHARLAEVVVSMVIASPLSEMWRCGHAV